MESFGDRLIVILCKITSQLPFWVIYRLADLFYVILYYLLKYRRNVVHMNLTLSFPEKSPEEIRQINKKFYRHFTYL